MISYYFPPTHSVAVIRNLTFANYFSGVFSSISVLTPKQPENAMRDESMVINDRIKVQRIPKFDYRNLFLKFNRDGNIHLQDDKRRTKFRQFLIRLINTIPFNYFIGEGGLYYILKSYHAAKRELIDQRTKVIFTSFRPYADHYVAWMLKGKWKDAMWIADFRDLHVDPLYNHVLFPKWQKSLNARILSRADKVVTVSEGLARSLRKIHPNVVVMENPVHPRAIDSEIEKEEKFTISYTGSLYGEERDPSILLKVIRKLILEGHIDKSQFQFIYAGKDSVAMQRLFQEEDLTEILVDLGLVTREKSLEVQERSHIQLLLTSSIPEMEGILTGKFLEYLGSYDPIITIINGSRDSIFEDLYGQFEIGHLSYNDDSSFNGLLNHMIKQINRWTNGKSLLNLEKRKAVQQHFSWEGKIEKLLDLKEIKSAS